MASIASANKHLSSLAKREKAVRLTIATSSAIEGIHAPFKSRDGAVKKVASKGKTSKAGNLKPRRAKSAE
ncbi:MAG: hypothetical protein WKF61_02160 [Luteimonas sp.]